MNGCIGCVWSGKCCIEDGARKNCTAYLTMAELAARPGPVQHGTCIRLVISALAKDRESMQESIQQLLSEIPNSTHAALGDALVQLGGMVFRECYRDALVED